MQQNGSSIQGRIVRKCLICIWTALLPLIIYSIQGVVAACEVVNCNSVEVQCEVDLLSRCLTILFHQVIGFGSIDANILLCFLMIWQGSAPTISIDNTSGCQLYLSKESLETSITTAKSSEINALVPDANSDGDWVSTFLNSFHLPSVTLVSFL